MFGPPRDLRGRVIVALAIGAVGEVAWTIVLGLRLPNRYVAHHWTLTWVGIDVIEIVMLLVTAFLAWRRRPGPLALSASATAMLYVVDAWFDVTTAGRGDVADSALMLILEIPVALVLWWVAGRALRRVGAAAQRETPSRPSR
ncbi:MAG TPA: hypothetical protein PLS29_09310 [Acidimicrobiales bacterium]|nr:MAG: hypothetical protein B7Z69_02815 [Actinobacteria bacterium 21-73-9]HQU27211.1 hypothetical protein [Acidimicrobiales bacterium]